MKKPRRRTQGQFLIVTAILIAVLTLSVAVSISQMSLQRQEQKYEPVRELTLSITSDLERALTYALSRASQYYIGTYDPDTAKTEGNEAVSRWVRSVIATYAHLGLRLNVSVSPNSFSFNSWWSETAMSSVDALFDMDADAYGFKGWTGHSAKYVMLRIFPESIDMTQPNRTELKFEITQSSLSQDEGVPIPNLVNSSLRSVYIRANGAWIWANKYVEALEYLGGGNYSLTLGFKVNGQTRGIALALSTPEDDVCVCASYYDENYVEFDSTEENLATAHLGWVQLGDEDSFQLPQSSILNSQTSMLKYSPQNSSYTFLNWTTAGQVQVADPYSNETAINIRGNGTVIAYYRSISPPPSMVSVTLDSRQDDDSTINLGSIMLGSDLYDYLPRLVDNATGDYALQYIPLEGYAFLRWESSGGIILFNSGSNPTTVRVAGNGAITAVYTNSSQPPVEQVIVVMQSIEEGTGTSMNLGMIQVGLNFFTLPNSTSAFLGTYFLEYTPKEGYTFLRWTTVGNVVVANPFSSFTSLSINGAGSVTAYYTGCNVTLRSRYWETPVFTNLGNITLGTKTYVLPNTTGLPGGDYWLQYTPYNFSYVFLWWECEPFGTIIPWDSTSDMTIVTINGAGNITAVYDFIPDQPPPPPPVGDWSTLYVDKGYKIVPPFMWSGKNSHLPSKASTGAGKQEVILFSPPCPTIYLARLVNITAYIRPNPPNSPMRTVDLELGFQYEGQYYKLGTQSFTVDTKNPQEVYRATLDTEYGEFPAGLPRGVIPEGSTIVLKAYVTFIYPPGGTFFLFYGPSRPSNIELF